MLFPASLGCCRLYPYFPRDAADFAVIQQGGADFSVSCREVPKFLLHPIFGDLCTKHKSGASLFTGDFLWIYSTLPEVPLDLSRLSSLRTRVLKKSFIFFPQGEHYLESTGTGH